MKDCLGACCQHDPTWVQSKVSRRVWLSPGKKLMHATLSMSVKVAVQTRHTSAGASTKLGIDGREGKDKIQLIGRSMHASAWGGVCSCALDTAEGPCVEGNWCDLLGSLCCLVKRVSTGNKQKWRTWSMEALLQDPHTVFHSFSLFYS